MKILCLFYRFTKGIRDNHNCRLNRFQWARSSPEVRAISQFKYFNSLENPQINWAKAITAPTSINNKHRHIHAHCTGPISSIQFPTIRHTFSATIWFITVLLANRNNCIHRKRNCASHDHSNYKHQHLNAFSSLLHCLCLLPQIIARLRAIVKSRIIKYA